MNGPVFLSASEPARDRNPAYWNTQVLVNIRGAVKALCARILPFWPLVYGGHPAITPLVNAIARDVAHTPGPDGSPYGQPQIACYQSLYFPRVRELPEDIRVIKTPEIEGRDELESRHLSLLLMRYLMLDAPEASIHQPEAGVLREGDLQVWQNRVAQAGPLLQRARADRVRAASTGSFTAGVFIGGMEGVECEFNIFRSFHPETPAYVLPTTGAAAERKAGVLADQDPALRDMLMGETSYTKLFQTLFPLTDLAPPPWRGIEPTPEERMRHANWSF